MANIQVRYDQSNISPSTLQEILDVLILTHQEEEDIKAILDENDVQYYD